MPYAAPDPITPEPRGGAWTVADPIDPRYGPNPIMPEPRGGAWTVIFIQMPNKTSVGWSVGFLKF